VPRLPLPAAVRALAVALGVVALVNVPDALILLRVSQVGFTPAEVVAAYALLNLTNALVAFPAGALSDRWPRSRVYALGLACFAIGTVGLALVPGGWPVLALLAVYGCFAGITDGVGKAWMSALAPAEVRGHAQGLLQGLAGGGVLVAGLWAGLAWTSGPGSGVVPLLLAGGVAGASALTMWAVGARLAPVRPAG
jgi:MFS family permease